MAFCAGIGAFRADDASIRADSTASGNTKN
jgi:hypothetical protein